MSKAPKERGRGQAVVIAHRHLRPLLPLLLMGCIQTAKGPAAIAFVASAPSPQAIASCQSAQTWQNIFVVTSAVFGALSGFAGVVAGLVPDSGQKLAFGIGSGGTAALGTLSTSLSGIEANLYAQKNCQVVLQQAAP